MLSQCVDRTCSTSPRARRMKENITQCATRTKKTVPCASTKSTLIIRPRSASRPVSPPTCRKYIPSRFVERSAGVILCLANGCACLTHVSHILVFRQHAWVLRVWSGVGWLCQVPELETLTAFNGLKNQEATCHDVKRRR